MCRSWVRLEAYVKERDMEIGDFLKNVAEYRRCKRPSGFMDDPARERESINCNGRRGDDTKNKINKNYMANVGIEPKTFALLARRSNQLS